LGIAEIHHLIEEFVDNNKIISNRFFLELFEVLDQDLGEAMKEENDLGGVGILP